MSGCHQGEELGVDGTGYAAALIDTTRHEHRFPMEIGGGKVAANAQKATSESGLRLAQ